MNSDSPFQIPLIVIATTNAIIVTTYILAEFYCAILRDVMLYGKHSESQWIVQLGAQIDEFICAAPFMESDKLLDFLKKLTPDVASDIGFTKESLAEYEKKINVESRGLTFFSEYNEPSEISLHQSSYTNG